MMTRQEIRDMARRRLGEVSGVFWSDTELNSWILEACDDLAFKTKSVRTNGYMTSTVNIADYVLSTNFPTLLSVFEVYFKIGGSSTGWKKLNPITSRQDLDLRYPGWMNTSAGQPHSYYYDKEEDNLMIYPKPNSTNAGANYVRVYYGRTFPGFTSDTVEPSPNLPGPLHLAVVDWVTSLGYETRGYGDKANDAMEKYNKRIADYLRERQREKEDDEIIMRSYRH